uniref:Uncharacterized protein n=1 Tax=Siphoviridae sp. ctqw35 TaxID=2826471 RepID=A0A8S5LZQ3_9CAUD|nr:MAG TPA: hypothetical protein [Siphoviridae sp. ctqw35]
MIKEQDKAIKRCNKLIETEHSNWIGITNQKAIETVLNMLKEKEAEIEKYKKLLVDNLAKNLNDSIKAKEKANTDLEDLNIGWQLELEKKDKMIDLMAEFIEKVTVDLKVAFGENMLWNQNEIKQYFERKAEESSSINKTQEKN